MGIPKREVGVTIRPVVGCHGTRQNEQNEGKGTRKEKRGPPDGNALSIGWWQRHNSNAHAFPFDAVQGSMEREG